MSPVDARGVTISPGDTCLYGFGVSRSVAMAEGEVLADTTNLDKGPLHKVSLTQSGRVKIRVTRRSYGGGEKPVVDVAPDRLVVLKRNTVIVGDELCHGFPYLPSSPLPTQDEVTRVELERRIKRYTDDLRSTEITWGKTSFKTLAEFHAFAARQLTELRRKLRELD